MTAPGSTPPVRWILPAVLGTVIGILFGLGCTLAVVLVRLAHVAVRLSH